MYLEQVASELAKKLASGETQQNSYDLHKMAVQETINQELAPEGPIAALFSRSKDIVTKELVSIILKDKVSRK